MTSVPNPFGEAAAGELPTALIPPSGEAATPNGTSGPSEGVGEDASKHAAEDAAEPAGARRRRGLFAAGDRVQLSDPKGRKHTVVLQPGKQFHTHKGALAHDALIGSPEGVLVESTGGTTYVALRPLLSDFVLSMPRGATVVYPKDAAAIVGQADVFPGARVLEAGAGSGALSCSLLRAVGDEGSVLSYERREDFAAVAARNVEAFFGGPHPAWTLRHGDLTELSFDEVHPDDGLVVPPGGIDRVVLDMLSPWEVLPTVATALVPGGVVCAYVATTTQMSRLMEHLRAVGGFTEPAASETMVRTWHVEGLAVRPDHRMIGHTGFLVTSRRLAPGVTAPPLRRRPAKAGQSDEPEYGKPAATDTPEPPFRPVLP
jgi:tRNA (adenine57-N1/adenine58-N1)-methyltransferase